MLFNAEQEIIIRDQVFRVTRYDPNVAEAYYRQGESAVVYHLTSGNQTFALKVFPTGERPVSEGQPAEIWEKLAGLPGFKIARRWFLSIKYDRDLLRQYPELTGAVLMPWVDGLSWAEVLQSKRKMPVTGCLDTARSLAQILEKLEASGLSHGNLTGINLILENPYQVERTTRSAALQIVDLETITVTGAGNHAQNSPLGRARSDRFAGALLLAEILCSHAPEFIEMAQSGSYFLPHELAKPGQKYDRLIDNLSTLWGKAVADLFAQAWQSPSSDQCPSFSDWLKTLPKEVPPAQPVVRPDVQTVEPKKDMPEVAQPTPIQDNNSLPNPPTRSRLPWWIAAGGIASLLCIAIVIGVTALSLLSQGGANPIVPTSIPQPSSTVGQDHLPTNTSRAQPTSVSTATNKPVKTSTQAPTSTRAPTSAPVQLNFTAYITVATANLREGPNTAFPIVKYIQRGIAVSAIGRNRDGSWLYVRTDGLEGWLSISTIEYTFNVNDLPEKESPPIPTLPPTALPTSPPSQYP